MKNKKIFILISLIVFILEVQAQEEHCLLDHQEAFEVGGESRHHIEKMMKGCLEGVDWKGQNHPFKKLKKWEVDPFQRYQQLFPGKSYLFQIGDVNFEGNDKERTTFIQLIGKLQGRQKGVDVSQELLEDLKKSPCPQPITIACALEQLYGLTEPPQDSAEDRYEAGIRAMIVQKEFGYVISPRKYIRDRSNEYIKMREKPQWSLNAVKQIELVLRRFPPSFYHLDTVKYVYRTMKADQSLLHYNTNAYTYTGYPGEIVLKHSTFNGFWHQEKKGMPEDDQFDGSCTYAHEMAHAFEYQFPEKVKALRLFTSNENRWGFNILTPRGTRYRGLEKISNYAFKNRREYFAVSVDKYMCEPEELMKVAPELYQVLKDHIFEQREFVGESLERGYWKKTPHIVQSKITEKLKTINWKEHFRPLLKKCFAPKNKDLIVKIMENKVTKKPQLHYYQPSYIQQKNGEMKKILLGRSIDESSGQRCLNEELFKQTNHFMKKFPDCSPPDRDLLFEYFKEQFWNGYQHWERGLIGTGKSF
jgi:hypothetical protein